MDCINCSICGDNLTDEGYKHTLKCGHSFHYQCLLLSFKTMRNTSCPYCRSTNNTLPFTYLSEIVGLRTSVHASSGISLNSSNTKNCNPTPLKLSLVLSAPFKLI